MCDLFLSREYEGIQYTFVVLWPAGAVRGVHVAGDFVRNARMSFLSEYVSKPAPAGKHYTEGVL